MRLEFDEQAAQELEDATAYYDAKGDDLGERFLHEVGEAIQRIRAHPKAWAQVSRRSRRCLLHRFPYGLIYQVREDMILLLAVMHLSRRPGYWRDRETT
jgi:plasmid stabilization system protein ParE